ALQPGQHPRRRGGHRARPRRVPPRRRARARVRRRPLQPRPPPRQDRRRRASAHVARPLHRPRPGVSLGPGRPRGAVGAITPAMRTLPHPAFVADSAASPAFAQETYHLPPKTVVDLVDARPTPVAEVSPDRKTLLVLESRALPSIAEVAEPVLRLAGVRF